VKDPEIDELLALARRCPAPPGEVFAGATEQEIAGAETMAGRSFPSGLRGWLGVVNGAMIGPGGIFGVRDANEFLSIDRYFKMFPEWRDSGWIPVASDGVGNYWVSVPEGPDGSRDWIAFVDVRPDPVSVDRYFSSSFLIFLRFLLEAELGEKRWPTDREYTLERDPALSYAPKGQEPWAHR
jgi:hypothetical protein